MKGLEVVPLTAVSFMKQTLQGVLQLFHLEGLLKAGMNDRRNMQTPLSGSVRICSYKPTSKKHKTLKVPLNHILLINTRPRFFLG